MADGTPKVVYTAHGRTSVQERGIQLGWVEATLFQPDWTTPDPRPDRRRAFKAIAANENRILRVVYAETDAEIRVITVFFDRDAKKP